MTAAIATGKIDSSIGVWTYEVAVANDSRLVFSLRAPDGTSRTGLAKDWMTVADVERSMRKIVASRDPN